MKLEGLLQDGSDIDMAFSDGAAPTKGGGGICAGGLESLWPEDADKAGDWVCEVTEGGALLSRRLPRERCLADSG